jgi:hypothetical protein
MAELCEIAAEQLPIMRKGNLALPFYLVVEPLNGESQIIFAFRIARRI